MRQYSISKQLTLGELEIDPQTGLPITDKQYNWGSKSSKIGHLTGADLTQRETGVNLDDYYGDYIIGTDNEDRRAVRQDVGEKWLHGTGKLALTLTGAVAENTIGVFAGLGSLVTGGSYQDNIVGRTVDSINEWAQEKMPHYYTKQEQDREWYKNLGTANFWSDKFANGLGYSLGSVATMYLTGGAGMLTKSLGWIGRESGLSNAMWKVGKEVGKWEKLGAVTSQIKPGTIGNLGKALKFADAGITMSLAEASVEARETAKNLKQDLINQYLEENGGRGEQDIPLAKLEEIERLAAAGSNVNMLSNMAILSTTNLLQFRRMVAGNFKDLQRQAVNKVGVDDAGKMVDATVKTGKKGLLNEAWHRSKPFMEGALEEGFQEGAQHASNLAATEYYKRKFANPEKEGFNLWLKDIAEASAHTLGSNEGQEAIFLGAIIGGPMQSVHRFGERHKLKENTQKAINFVENNWKDLAEYSRIMNDRIGDNLRTGSYIADAEKAAKEGNRHEFENAKAQAFASYVSGTMKLGGFEAMMDKLDRAKEMSEEEFKEEFQFDKNQPLPKAKEEIIEELKTKAEGLRKVKENIDSKFTNRYDPKKDPEKYAAYEALKEGLYFSLATIENADERETALANKMAEISKDPSLAKVYNNLMAFDHGDFDSSFLDTETVIPADPVEYEKFRQKKIKEYRDQFNKKIEEVAAKLDKTNPDKAKELRIIGEDLNKIAELREDAIEIYNTLANAKKLEQEVEDIVEDQKAEAKLEETKKLLKETADQITATLKDNVARGGKVRNNTNNQIGTIEERENGELFFIPDNGGANVKIDVNSAANFGIVTPEELAAKQAKSKEEEIREASIKAVKDLISKQKQKSDQIAAKVAETEGKINTLRKALARTIADLKEIKAGKKGYDRRTNEVKNFIKELEEQAIELETLIEEHEAQIVELELKQQELSILVSYTQEQLSLLENNLPVEKYSEEQHLEAEILAEEAEPRIEQEKARLNELNSLLTELTDHIEELKTRTGKLRTYLKVLKETIQERSATIAFFRAYEDYARNRASSWDSSFNPVLVSRYLRGEFKDNYPEYSDQIDGIADTIKEIKEGRQWKAKMNALMTEEDFLLSEVNISNESLNKLERDLELFNTKLEQVKQDKAKTEEQLAKDIKITAKAKSIAGVLPDIDRAISSALIRMESKNKPKNVPEDPSMIYDPPQPPDNSDTNDQHNKHYEAARKNTIATTAGVHMAKNPVTGEEELVADEIQERWFNTLNKIKNIKQYQLELHTDESAKAAGLDIFTEEERAYDAKLPKNERGIKMVFVKDGKPVLVNQSGNIDKGTLSVAANFHNPLSPKSPIKFEGGKWIITKDENGNLRLNKESLVNNYIRSLGRKSLEKYAKERKVEPKVIEDEAIAHYADEMLKLRIQARAEIESGNRVAVDTKYLSHGFPIKLPMQKDSNGKNRRPRKPIVGNFIESLNDIEEIQIAVFNKDKQKWFVNFKGDERQALPGVTYIKTKDGRVIDVINSELENKEVDLVIDLIKHFANGKESSSSIPYKIEGKGKAKGEQQTLNIFHSKNTPKGFPALLSRMIYYVRQPDAKNPQRYADQLPHQLHISFTKDKREVYFGGQIIPISALGSEEFREWVKNKFLHSNADILENSKGKPYHHPVRIEVKDKKPTVILKEYKPKGDLSGYEVFLMERLFTDIVPHTETQYAQKYVVFEPKLKPVNTPKQEAKETKEEPESIKRTPPKIKFKPKRKIASTDEIESMKDGDVVMGVSPDGTVNVTFELQNGTFVATKRTVEGKEAEINKGNIASAKLLTAVRKGEETEYFQGILDNKEGKYPVEYHIGEPVSSQELAKEISENKINTIGTNELVDLKRGDIITFQLEEYQVERVTKDSIDVRSTKTGDTDTISKEDYNAEITNLKSKPKTEPAKPKKAAFGNLTGKRKINNPEAKNTLEIELKAEFQKDKQYFDKIGVTEKDFVSLTGEKDKETLEKIREKIRNCK